MSQPSYARRLRDASLTVSKALPAANAANATDPIDLGQDRIQSLEAIEFEIAVPALPALVEDKVITISVEDSADGETFAPVDPLVSTTITGGAGNGAGEKTTYFRLPSQTRRHVRLAAAVETGGGNNTAVSYTLSALT